MCGDDGIVHNTSVLFGMEKHYAVCSGSVKLNLSPHHTKQFSAPLFQSAGLNMCAAAEHCFLLFPSSTKVVQMHVHSNAKFYCVGVFMRIRVILESYFANKYHVTETYISLCRWSLNFFDKYIIELVFPSYLSMMGYSI